jgi:stage II sporulation protein D
VSANAIGGTAPYSYKFWVFNGSSWTVGRDWGASATWAWIPPAAGTYTVQVWARNAGSTALYDAWLSSVPLTVTGTAPLVVTRLWLITDPPSLQVPLVWSAAATGGTAPYTYRFLYHDGTSWSVGQDWSPSPQWIWSPPAAGRYDIQVWVRNAGSTALYDAWLGTVVSVFDASADAHSGSR